MTEAEYRELLDALRAYRGRVMLSGYPSALYVGALAGWSRHTFDLPNNAAGGKRKGRETEVVWCNFRGAGPPWGRAARPPGAFAEFALFAEW
jgi:DNA adenine methylase